MDVEVNSHKIISECSKQYGKGELFFRGDGLQSERRRAESRRQYLESHPGTDPEYRRAILDAAATPGMTRDQVVAAWGLLEEDTRLAFGNVTEDRLAAYGYFNGFTIGASYTLYLKDDFVVGIRQTDELVPPHEEELDMRLAEENQGLHYFYEGGDGNLRGSDVDQVHIDWDTLHHHLYRIEPVHGVSVNRIEQHIKSKGLLREYEIAFVRLGYDSRTAPAQLRSRIALSTLPYTGLRLSESVEQETPSMPMPTNAPAPAPRAPILLSSSSLEPPEDPTSVPPEKWFAYLAFGHQQEVAFPCADDRVELVRVEWMRERLFRVDQVPLLVNGVSLYDLVEVEWQEGDLIPRFKRVAESCGHRTIRAVVNDSNVKKRIRRFAEVNVSDPKRYRFENAVLAFTIAESELDEIAKEWLGYLPLSWMYTDTLTQL